MLCSKIRPIFSNRQVRLISSDCIKVDNPYSGEVYCEVPLIGNHDAKQMVKNSSKAFESWKKTSLTQRQNICEKWINILQDQSDRIAKDITGQMGKPFKQAKGEINGTIDRARVLLDLSTEVLSPDVFPEENGLYRRISKEPVGVSLILAPWNYPLMTAVNAVIPALLCGNSVIIKHSPRTPLCANHYVETFSEAGLPEDVLSALHCSNDTVASVIGMHEVGVVSFTGSVKGGHDIHKLVSNRFIHSTLELGGKDPGYVAEDADIDLAVAGLVDGAFYNAGQSCCAIERIYVHASKYEEFVEKAKNLVGEYSIGDPMNDSTTLGPMALPTASDFLEEQVKDATSKGARILTPTGKTKDQHSKGRFFTPTLLADCNHKMRIMKEESFGPLVPVMPVSSDEEAVEYMNDSSYGLTSAIFTQDKERALRMGQELQSGTVFMNRCDALDPYLPWTGVKDSGKGQSLSKYGFSTFMQLKSYNFRL